MDFKDLTPEQRAKVGACKTPQDILALAKQEGYELSDAELEVVSGGEWGGEPTIKVHCVYCESIVEVAADQMGNTVNCPSCGKEILISSQPYWE